MNASAISVNRNAARIVRRNVYDEVIQRVNFWQQTERADPHYKLKRQPLARRPQAMMMEAAEQMEIAGTFCARVSFLSSRQKLSSHLLVFLNKGVEGGESDGLIGANLTAYLNEPNGSTVAQLCGDAAITWHAMERIAERAGLLRPDYVVDLLRATMGPYLLAVGAPSYMGLDPSQNWLVPVLRNGELLGVLTEQQHERFNDPTSRVLTTFIAAEGTGGRLSRLMSEGFESWRVEPTKGWQIRAKFFDQSSHLLPKHHEFEGVTDD